MRCLTLLLLLFFKTNCLHAQWINLNSGINDNLTGVVFLQNNGLVSGEHGLYYTTTGGVGASSWTRFSITNNTNNSLVYENTVFTHCYTIETNTTNTGIVYACGQNTLTNKAVLFKISLPSMTYQIRYTGSVNSKLNKIDYCPTEGRYIAVGDHGLMISFTDTSLSILNSGTTDDLMCLKFDTNSWFEYGSPGKIRRTSFYGNTLSNTTIIDTPNATVKDIDIPYAVGGDYFLSPSFGTTNSVSRNTNYYGPLSSNCVFEDNGFIYVGTNQGIYRMYYSSTTGFTNNTLEWQPSSLNYTIKEFYKQSLIQTKYACGDNGVLLSTTINGGSTIPYVTITSQGGCYPGATSFSGFAGQITSAKWFYNNILFHSGLSTFNYTFPAAGTYTVTLQVQNSYGEQNTASQQVLVVTEPLINKVVTLSDNLLCKQESIEIQIDDAEPNVIYSLKKEGVSNSNYGQSAVSSGGTLVFSTDLIDLTGYYYIYAQNASANCGKRFVNNFLITVEETQANFHASLLNAQVNEPVDFYQNAVDSQNFEWQFGPNATITNATLPDVQSSFTQPGQAVTSLHAWSNNGCNDTVTQNVPFVYEPPTNQEDCFLLVNNSHDPQWPGYYNPDIAEMKPTVNGFFTCGTYFDEIFDSKYGITLSLAGKKGGYLAKHDRNGALKWVVYTTVPGSSDTNDNVIYSFVEDSSGNIYISGKGTGTFYDNAGHATNLGQNPLGFTIGYYLIKLNSKGELIWYLQNYVFGFVKLGIDHENNIVALSDFDTSFMSPQLFLNGVQTELIGQQITPMDEDATNEIIKFNPEGAVIWDTKVRLESANIREFYKVGFDASNNIYISMGYDIYARIYRPGTNLSQIIYGDGGLGGKIGIVKLNKNGLIQWLTQSGTENTTNNPNDGNRLYDMIVEDDGTLYFTGTNGTGINWYGSLDYTYVFHNTNGTTLDSQQGPYFVAKVNSAGVCQWIKGIGHTYYGAGLQLAKVGDELFSIGRISNNGADSCSGVFDSTDGATFELTIGASDYFIAVYDSLGNLKRVFLNGENSNDFYVGDFAGFFKGEGDYFYLAKNLGYYLNAANYSDFGSIVPQLNGRDGTVVRFTEACGIMKYDATLNNAVLSDSLLNLKIIPNPTTNEFSIPLKATFENVTMKVSDPSGKLIAIEHFSNSSEIKYAVTTQAGIYFVTLIVGDKQQNFKLIKL